MAKPDLAFFLRVGYILLISWLILKWLGLLASGFGRRPELSSGSSRRRPSQRKAMAATVTNSKSVWCSFLILVFRGREKQSIVGEILTANSYTFFQSGLADEKIRDLIDTIDAESCCLNSWYKRLYAHAFSSPKRNPAAGRIYMQTASCFSHQNAWIEVIPTRSWPEWRHLLPSRVPWTKPWQRGDNSDAIHFRFGGVWRLSFIEEGWWLPLPKTRIVTLD